MTAIPNLKVPITVQTDTITPALRKAEREIAASAARMERIKGALSPALSAAGGGLLKPALAGLSATGLGTAGLGIGALAIPFAGAARALDSLESSSKGAGEALNEFSKTGKQTFTATSAQLVRLAELERSMTARATFGQSFAIGAAAGGPQAVSTLQGAGSIWNMAGAGLGGLFSAALGGGQSINEIVAAMQLAGARTETEGMRAQAALAFAQQQSREYLTDPRMQRGAGVGGPITPTGILRDIFGAVNRLGKAMF